MKRSRHTWTGRDMAIVRCYATKRPLQEVADMIGVTYNALKKQMGVWRDNGYHIPNAKDKELGARSYNLPNHKRSHPSVCKDRERMETH